MSVQVDLKDVMSGFLSAEAFNANNTLIENALAKAINREGGDENSMLADFDMGYNNIFNVKRAVLSHQAVPFGQLIDFLAGSTSEVLSLVNMEDRITAFAGQTSIALQNIVYTPGTNSLMVFVDGEYQRAGFEYLETNSTTIDFTFNLAQGQVVDIFGSRYDAQQYVQLALEAAEQSAQDVIDANAAAQVAADAAEAATLAAGYKFDINDQTGVVYTLTMNDAGDFVRMDNPADNDVIVPSSFNVDFEIGTIVLVRQVGEGKTRILPEAGVTVNSPYASLSISDSDFGVALVKVAQDEWDLVKAFGGVDTEDLEAFNGEFDARIDDLFKELLSSNPTFIVNFDSLRNSLQVELDALIARLDSFEAGEQGDVQTLISEINRIDGELGNLNTLYQNLQAEVDQLEQSSESYDGSLSTTGWQELPGGLIIQWGAVTIPYYSARTFNFPLTFPNACFNVQVTQRQPVSNYTGVTETYSNLRSFDRSGITLEMTRIGDGEGRRDSTAIVYWTALGS